MPILGMLRLMKGLKRAVGTCRENNWESVLAMLQTMAPEAQA
ncbi:hypothetical protein [Govanella unica]|uniref:Uncharacterized protein n=1 Tax=Govanella unica TaxID=2975056 RepID=A0A9X3TXR9_9PROT|nr:hypothetical protein [Govania unica]MDA5193926.1 hypothetical protein [Govania unica]